MQALVNIVVLFIACGLVSASDNRLSDDCLNGVADRNKCCDGVPDSWYAHLRNPQDCTKFYQCESGKPTLKDCAAGTHWSVAADECDWPDKAKCIAVPAPDPTTTAVPTDSTTASVTSSTANPTDSTTASVTSSTANGGSSTANGGSSTANGGSSTAGGTKLPPGCYDGSIDAKTCCVGVSDFWVHLPDPANCGKFYQCDNGKAVHKDCPAGLHWSVSADRCEWPHLAGCTGGTPSTSTAASSEATTSSRPPVTTGSPPVTTSSPPTSTDAPPPPGDDCAPPPMCHQCLTGVFPADLCCRDVKTYYKLRLANADDCSSYYQCVDGKDVLIDCPAGLHWSIDSDRCEPPAVAQCGSTSTPRPGDGSTTTPRPGDGTTPADPPVSADCLSGKVSAEQCCRNVPSWVDVLLQNNADCHTYFQCVHGKPLVRPCPAGLWWSITRNRCEWKENATCTW